MPDHDDPGPSLIGEVAGAVAASSISELCWLDHHGRPWARGVVSLVRGTRPAIAFTYADESLAREAARSETVVLSIREPRSTGSAFRPLVLVGRPSLVEDRNGEVLVSELLKQELRRYPPARVYADSPLLMREHWWYLPRLILEIDVDAAEPMPARCDPRDHLLVVAAGQRPVVRPVALPATPGSTLIFELDLDGATPAPGPAVVFGQDASFPDLERWTQWCYSGVWDGSVMQVTQAPAVTGLEPPPGLLKRWRRHRALERRCVRALGRGRA